MAGLAQEVAVVGSGMVVHTTTDAARRRTPVELQVEAVNMALADAGIDRTQVDALLSAPSPPAQETPETNLLVMSELGIVPKYTGQIGASCAGALGSVQVAASLLAAEVADCVVCCSGDANYWEHDFSKEKLSNTAMAIGDPEFEIPYGVTAPAIYAQMASRYMHEFNISEAQLAKIAVANREWALDNPDARMFGKGSLTVSEVLDSPVIASPLHMYDCAPWFPGGVANAIVLTRREMARYSHAEPVDILGFGHCTTHAYLSDRLNLGRTQGVYSTEGLFPTGVATAARQAYAMSGLAPSDIDFIQSSGPFTFFLARLLEELGICPDGEVGDFIDSGNLNRGAQLGFNTYGGMLSFGQVAQTLVPLHEAIIQLRGDANERQLEKRDVGLVHGHGGPISSQSVVLLGRRARTTADN